ncbi:toll-interacting protein [Eurytemora carolleeae]|uniref:toll-interacting protein n=1 Tax=Eurytemora carolleeae TaxID=1294199 RepID=UPI000C755D5E|nr:toll-interacting protein [Eurytemora carolleeae]|eukprot:XP_023344927.1 toll-interacting protein-like [Eurytemora affinis]
MSEKEKMSAEEKRAERRKRAMLGPLPETFLRIPLDEQPLSEEERDREMALALQRQLNLQEQQQGQGQIIQAAGGLDTSRATGRLTITVVEAKLSKNYGVTRMDPYARIRVGHQIYETPTCTNGAREPKWNKTVNCMTMPGTKFLDVEIYDECTFSTDTLIAHASLRIPDSVLEKGELSDDWWPLSGQEGDGKEGMLHLILSMQKIQPGSVVGPGFPGPQVPLVVPNVSGGKPMHYTPTHLPVQQPAPPVMSEEDVEEFSRMFPGVEKSLIKEIYSTNLGDKEVTVNTLLELAP